MNASASPPTFVPRDYWSTSISAATSEHLLLRGYPLAEVIESLTFTQGVFLTLTGRIPNHSETTMFDALLNALLDHQFVSATVPAARYVASGNPQVVPAAAAGILSAGANTLSPEDSANFIRAAVASAVSDSTQDIESAAAAAVSERRAGGARIPGLGHPLYKTADPRARALLLIAEREGFGGPNVRMVKAIHEAFQRESGKTVALNVDGMMSAIMLEMGLSPRQMIAVNLLSYMPGIMAHSIEEIEAGVPLRTIPDALASYTGEPLRHLGES
ncbi:MAG: citryl-CoA lyase [Actinomycetota bacterium]|nr:citryl-CoA lyase [Actinomycetota bacterium]